MSSQQTPTAAQPPAAQIQPPSPTQPIAITTTTTSQHQPARADAASAITSSSASEQRSVSQNDMDLTSVGENGELSTSPPGSYTRIPPRSTEPPSVPPILPPHLLQVILNNPDKANSTILPQPNHVMLNHLYALSIKDGIMVLSATHRFRKKYVTTLLYKPI